MSNESFTERDYTIVSALALNYSSAYYVDFDADEIHPYRISDVIEQQSGSYFRSKPKYWDAITTYIERNTAPEDKEELLKVVSYENLCRELKDKKMFMYDYRVLRNGRTEYYRMKVANVTEGEGLHKAVMGFADISTQKTKDIERYAYYSVITGGYNYNRFKEELSKRTEKGALTAMDIYAFKIVNSTCGVQKGDEALKAAWRCIVDSIDEDDYAAHINADHFVIFFSDTDHDSINRKLALITERLEAMSKEMEIPRMSPYFGTAEWEPGDLPEQIYGNATFAKHSIKGDSSRNYAYYSKEDSDKIMLAKQMEDAFEGALANREFEVWFQPKYNPGGNELMGAEALVRWRKDGKLVSPGLFIPVFEKNGMIRRLDEYVFRSVCCQQKKWKEQGMSMIPVSVNISRVSLYFQNVVETYKNILDEYDIQPQLIPLEITESAAVANAEIKALTDKFFNMGFSLHMDDFGTGYSSLSSLNQMHFNTLKLDKSIIDYIGNYGGDKLLEHTIALAKDLGLHVTAEGVENETQINFLKELHCDSIQGYYFSKPLPLDEFTERLGSRSAVFEESVSDKNGNMESCNIREVVDEAIAAAAPYVKARVREFNFNTTPFTDMIYINRESVKELLKSIIELTADKVSGDGSVLFIVSEVSVPDMPYVSYKFVAVGINAHGSYSDINSIMRSDPRIAVAQKLVGMLGGSIIGEMEDNKDLDIVVRLPFKKADQPAAEAVSVE